MDPQGFFVNFTVAQMGHNFFSNLFFLFFQLFILSKNILRFFDFVLSSMIDLD